MGRMGNIYIFKFIEYFWGEFYYNPFYGLMKGLITMYGLDMA